MVTPSELLQHISAGRFKPAYYFYGSEDYRIVEAEKYVVRQFLPDLQRAANYRRIDGKKTKAADLVTELSNLPMLGEKQVFAVSDFQSYTPAEIQRILSLLTPADPNRIVIFSSPSSKVPRKKSAFFSAVSKSTETVEFKRLGYREAESQIESRFRKEEIDISPEALRLLTELIDGSKGALDAELAKLTNFKQKGETVEEEDVRMVSAGYEVFDVFELADLIIAGETKRALKMIRSLLAGGISATALIALLQQHFTSLYLVKNGKKPLGRRAFLTYKFKQQGQKYENARLEQIILEIAAADSRLRHTGLKPQTTVEMLALTLAGENR